MPSNDNSDPALTQNLLQIASHPNFSYTSNRLFLHYIGTENTGSFLPLYLSLIILLLRLQLDHPVQFLG